MDVSYCGACGAPLASKSAKMCVKCGADPRIAVAYCPGCGEKLKSKGAVICPECGFPLRGASGDKDPGIAALIAVVGLLALGGAAAIGYFYLGKIKKGLIYLILNWVITAILVAVLLFGMFGVTLATFGFGAFCCMPFFFLALLVPVLLGFVVVYDVYLEAKGEKPILPGPEE